MTQPYQTGAAQLPPIAVDRETTEYLQAVDDLLDQLWQEKTLLQGARSTLSRVQMLRRKLSLKVEGGSNGVD